jgi:hypothetical protein
MLDEVRLATRTARSYRDEMMPTKSRVGADALNHPEDRNDALRDMAAPYVMKARIRFERPRTVNEATERSVYCSAVHEQSVRAPD